MGSAYGSRRVLFALPFLTLILQPGLEPSEFLRGDVNGDARVDISDPIAILISLFLSGEELPCLEAADGNDDGVVNIADPIRILTFLFLDAAPLPDPYWSCGSDPTPDELGCLSHPPCVDGAIKVATTDEGEPRLYPTGRAITIGISDPDAQIVMTEGHVRIASRSQGYDSGFQPTSGPTDEQTGGAGASTSSWLYFRWDTAGLAPADDYVIMARVRTVEGILVYNSSLVLALAPNPPSPNRLISEIDISVPAPALPVRFLRTYLLESRFDGPLGYGWSHSYLMRAIESSDGHIELVNADGTSSYYRRLPDGSLLAPKGDFRTLTRTPDAGFFLRTKHGLGYVFSVSGQLQEITDPNGNRTTLTYNARDLVASLTDSAGQVTTISYTAEDRIAAVTDPAGRSVTYGYDDQWNLAVVRDFAANETRYSYDASHNLTKVTDPEGRSIVFSVYPYDRLESVGLEDGASRLVFEYPGLPGPVAGIVGAGLFTGEMIVTDGAGSRMVLGYDVNSRITSIADSLGNVTRLGYDADLNLVSATDPRGLVTSAAYDGKGNPIRITCASGQSVSFTYGADFSQITNVTDPLGRMTVFTYDSLGNLSEMIYPNGARETFFHDEQGCLSARTDRKGQTIQYDHDSRGKLVKVTFPDGKIKSFTYDVFGNMTAAGDEGGRITFEYDFLDRVVRTVDASGDAISYTWDDAGNRTRLTYPDGSFLSYVYDSFGRIAAISDAGGDVAVYTYDARGMVGRRVIRNGTSTTIERDAVGQILSIVNRDAGGAEVSSFRYAYDAAGNIVAVTGPRGMSRYEYDAVGQLVKVTDPTGAVTSYEYDAFGNRTKVDDAGYTTNALNQYEAVGPDSYTYDETGNLTRRQNPSGTTTYTYDFENRLVGVSGPTGEVSYRYDPLGRRIARVDASGTTRYLYSGFRMLREAGDATKVYRYGIGLDELLELRLDGAEYFYLQDRVGSVTDMTGIGGTAIESYEYDAFGLPKSASAIGNPFRFTGAPYDASTGTYNMRLREYDPRLGRFLSEDPIGFHGGLNLYLYVNNSPIVFNDPYGLRRTFWGYLREMGWGALIGGSVSFGGAVATLPLKAPFVTLGPGGIVAAVAVPTLWGALGGAVGGAVNYNLRGDEPEDREHPDGKVPHKDEGDGSTDGQGGPDTGDGEGKPPTASGDPTFIQLSESAAGQRFLPRREVRSEGLVARISVPYQDSIVRGDVPICGVAYGTGFRGYRIEYGEGSSPTSWNLIVSSEEPRQKDVSLSALNSGDVTLRGNLGNWDTGLREYVYLPQYPADHPVNLKGTYTLRLQALGEGGNVAEDRITLEVGCVVANAWGGSALADGERARLEIPEQSLTQPFRLFSIGAAGALPAPLPGGLGEHAGAYRLRPAGERFTAPVSLVIDPGDGETGAADVPLVIYGFDGGRKEWLRLPTRRMDGRPAYAAEIDRLLPFYALVRERPSVAPPSASLSVGAEAPMGPPRSAGDTPPEGESGAGERLAALEPALANGFFLVRETFEESTGGWSNRGGELGGQAALDKAALSDGSGCLRVTAGKPGGNMAVNVLAQPYDAAEYPIVRFDYRIPPGVRTDFLVKVAGRWYDIGFTDSPNGLDNARVNIARVGAIEGVVADDRWHTARFDLHQMLRTKTNNTIVDRIVMSDWDVPGYMKLALGNSPQGATYLIDDFSISRDPQGGMRLTEDPLLIDDFNKQSSTNAFGGQGTLFSGSPEERLTSSYVEGCPSGKGSALCLKFEIPDNGSFAGYSTELLNLDVRCYQILSFRVRGRYEDMVVGMAGSDGTFRKVAVAPYVRESAAEWKHAEVPVAAITCPPSGRKGAASLKFALLRGSGEVAIDSVALSKGLGDLPIHRFDDESLVNLLNGPDDIWLRGDVALARKCRRDASGQFLAISFGGAIGEPSEFEGGLNFATWTTRLQGIDCSRAGALSFRLRGAAGGETPQLGLYDGNFGWCLPIVDFGEVTTEWKTFRVPLERFAEVGIDLSHLDGLMFAFGRERMSGALYVDDIRVESPEVPVTAHVEKR